MLSHFELDHRGIAETLKSAGVRAALHPHADPAAAQIRSAHPDVEVVVDDYTTDRAAVSITIKDRRAIGWQARDGVLTRAIAATGLEVRSK